MRRKQRDKYREGERENFKVLGRLQNDSSKDYAMQYKH